MLVGNGQQHQNHQKGGDHAGEERDAAHAGDGVLVYLSFVGDIVEFLALTIVQYRGREHKPADQTH